MRICIALVSFVLLGLTGYGLYWLVCAVATLILKH